MKIADISAYQDVIDWEKARQELELVIFRASIGYNIDKKYLENANACGIPFGVYHYFKASTVEEAIKETKYFYECATKDGLTPLFFVPDIEYKTFSSSNTKIICEAIFSTLKDLGAEKIGIYISQHLYHYIEVIRNKFDFIWIPRYGKNNGEIDEKYKPKFICDIWQYTSAGKVNGIKGNVDLNKLCGNKELEWYTKSNQCFKNAFFYLGYRTVREGNQGKDVKELQIVLNKLGYNCGEADGKFGNKTKNALKCYQKDNNLVIDGMCGKHTISNLLNNYKLS